MIFASSLATAECRSPSSENFFSLDMLPHVYASTFVGMMENFPFNSLFFYFSFWVAKRLFNVLACQSLIAFALLVNFCKEFFRGNFHKEIFSISFSS